MLIEDLQIGDLVVTASGAARPVRWLGRSVLNSQDRGRPEVIWPVRVAKGAFGESLAGARSLGQPWSLHRA